MMLPVRNAGPGDVEALARLHAACFAEVWSASSLAELMSAPGAIALLAEEGHAPCGFVLARVAGGEAEILTLAVSPERRRRGLGRALVCGAGEMAAERGATRLYLEVAMDNRPACGLYAKLGFEEVGRRTAYYARPGQPPSDALVLSVDLPLPDARLGNMGEPG